MLAVTSSALLSRTFKCFHQKTHCFLDFQPTATAGMSFGNHHHITSELRAVCATITSSCIYSSIRLSPKLFNKSDPKLHLVGVDSTESTHTPQSYFIHVGNQESSLMGGFTNVLSPSQKIICKVYGKQNVEVQKREIRYILSTLQDYHAKKKKADFHNLRLLELISK